MALTPFQRSVCRLLAETRIASGESYVARGVALNELLAAPRRSRHIDVFHGTDSALRSTWDSDRSLLAENGFEVSVLRQLPTFIEARIAKQGEVVLVQWARDSSYRFFPLVEHPDLGLALHPFDLATSKVLALVGRLEPRDWIDVIECNDRLQPLGYLAWAACGKDPAFSPKGIIEEAARSGRYSATEILALDFAGQTPDPKALARRWHELIASARRVVGALPPAEAGRCVLDSAGGLFRGGPDALQSALPQGRLRFHSGSIRGTLPRLVETE